ncbi:condensation domain-containing protein [Brenneria corticis]|uniref:Condensation protein n=1 Tax=Brenneria corticis TaxID=2173106 RepID=A0A2U1TYP9_9GAMM|nr:condensation domain-containing protein [Brenneria sp. CFCC 11842]PWC14545.1 condensation protein [Brenneria sp. CFCC 11842]
MTDDFNYGTVDDKARKTPAGDDGAIADEKQGDGRPLTPFEERAWLRHQQYQYTPDQSALAWRLGPEVRLGRLAGALEAVLREVPGLNVRYRFDEQGELRKFSVSPRIQPIAIEPIADEEQAVAALLREQEKPCELHLEPPVRFLLFVGGPHGVILGAVAHAILGKQLSWTQILTALSAIYNGRPLPAHHRPAARDGLTEGIWLANRGERINLPGLYRDEARGAGEIVDFGQSRSRHTCAATRYGATLDAARLAPFMPPDGEPPSRLTALAVLFGCYLSTAGAGEEITVGLPLADAGAEQEADDERLAQVRVRHNGRPLRERVAQAQASLASVGERNETPAAASDAPVRVIRLLDPSPSLRLEGVAAVRIPLPPARCSVDLALAVGDGPGETLSLELIAGPRVSPHIGGFLLERFVAWLAEPEAAASAAVDLPAAAGEGPREDEASPAVPPASDGAQQAGIADLILAEFREALASPRMTLDDDFFDFGGHSLIATRVIGRLLSGRDIEIHINDLFSHPTARGLAALARRGDGQSAAPPAAQTAHGDAADAPLSLAQQSLWKAYAAFDFGDIFNIPFALRFLDPVDETAFRQALLDVLERHSGLRTLFDEAQGEVRQRIVSLDDLPHYPWFGYSHQSAARDWRAALAQEAGHRFNLAAELPLRVRFIRDDESGQQILSLLFHHIVLDEWSVNLLMDELAHAYPYRAANRSPVWHNRPAPFHKFAIEQHKAGLNQAHLDYWLESLRGVARGKPLFAVADPAENGGASSSSAGGWVELKVEQAVADGLYRLAREQGASLFNVAYAGIAAALHALGAPDDLVIGTSASGRNDARFFDTIGYFTTVAAHRLRFSAGMTLAALIEQVKNNINLSLPYSDVPIDLVEEALSDGDGPDGRHIFEVFIQLHAKNKLNGCFTLQDGSRVSFRQVDPQKSESLLGLQFEVMEEIIAGETSIRVLMSYRSQHYDAARVDLIVAALTKAFARLAEKRAAQLPLESLLPPPDTENPASPVAARDTMTPVWDKARLRELLLPQLDADGEEIGDDENLLEYGLDSVRIMSLIAHWRSEGHEVDFISLMKNPTINGWRRLLTEGKDRLV